MQNQRHRDDAPDHKQKDEVINAVSKETHDHLLPLGAVEETAGQLPA